MFPAWLGRNKAIMQVREDDLPEIFLAIWLAHPKHRNYNRADVLDFHLDSRDCVRQATKLLHLIGDRLKKEKKGILIGKIFDFSTRCPTGNHATLDVSEWEEALVMSTISRDKFFKKGCHNFEMLTLTSQLLHDDHLPQVNPHVCHA
jgi:hypothetical protein